ncbi:aminoglycoside phosphotransferase family protein [Cohnella candidum]|uniref:Kinase n=1 Tax=Cohnella candidum TaxID=2674991 RepID=A0A3G3K0Q7_9BACL|nr:aminoglycoside phosphotransferase family protein [Cohnella candidum]AYQ74104.1 kinase [Cohnella candidum]
MQMPDTLAQTIRSVYGEEGEAWLAAFPSLVQKCESKWSLRLEEPTFPLSFNFVAPVRFEDGREAVLKLCVPSKESRSEIAALRWFDGKGAVRLLEAEPDEGILLMERVRPGLTLHTVRDEESAVKAAAEVMAKLHGTAPAKTDSLLTVEGWFGGYARLRDRFDGGTGPLPEQSVRLAEERYEALRENPTPHYLLHGDLHHGNLLSADREPWLAIDPKGVIGEAEYEPCSFLMNAIDESDPLEQIRRRVALFSESLGLDPRRILQWAYCHAVLSAWWCIEDGVGGADRQIGLAVHMNEALETL